MDPSNTTYVLVTGTNSGLGFGICQRLITEFLSTRSSERLHLIVTTRSSKKASDTIAGLQKVIDANGRNQKRQKIPAAERIIIQSESLDLVQLLSIRALARKLLASSLPRIDAIILNAGIWGVYDLNWPLAVFQILTDFVPALTFPGFHLSLKGALTAPQFPDLTPDAPATLINAPPLANVFASNTFGHYVLVHELMPLLRIPKSSSVTPARVVWVSSLDASDKISLDDIQGFTSNFAYDTSKRITDLLALTASSHSSKPYVEQFLTPTTTRTKHTDSTPSSDAINTTQPPQTFLCHPGIVTTNILPLPFGLACLWAAALLVARLLGSPFHTVTAYTAAVAPVFLTLSSYNLVTEMNSSSGPDGGGRGKWGSSAVGWRGITGVKRSFVPGYGGGGHVPASQGEEWRTWGFGDEAKGIPDRYSWATGRRRHAKKPTQDDVDLFYQNGAEAWRKMEELRVDWMERCEVYEKWKAGAKKAIA